MTNTSSGTCAVRNVGILALSVASILLSACSTKDASAPFEPTGPSGRVRLVNLITDPVRARVNATLEAQIFTVDLQFAQAAPANLPAPSTAPYAPVYTGQRTFVLVRTADPTATVATLGVTIATDQDNTVYAIGGAGGGAVTGFVTTDQNPAAGATETRLRIVNMSPTAGSVDVFVTAVGADLATATPRATLSYQAASAYFTVAPGTYQVRAVPAGTAPGDRAANVTINLASTTFTGRTGRTIVLRDSSGGGAPLGAFVLVDR
jgi:hypothetical protein